MGELNLAGRSRISYLPSLWFFFSSRKYVRTIPICYKKKKKEKKKVVIIKPEQQNDVSIQSNYPNVTTDSSMYSYKNYSLSNI